MGLPGEAFGLRQYRRGGLAADAQRQRPGRTVFRRRRGDLNPVLRRRQTQRRDRRRVGTQVQGARERCEAEPFPALPVDPIQSGEIRPLAQAGEDRALNVYP